MFVKIHEVPVESLEKTNEVFAVGLTVEKVEAHGFKKLSVKITYTNDLNLVTSKDEAIVNAIQEISVENITFKSMNKSNGIRSSQTTF